MDLPSHLDFHPRAGLPATAARLAAGSPVTIAYFGGSITQADGWRTGTFNWFKAAYPQVRFTEIMASIGGTGSDLGVYRMDKDVLAHQPDLMFVEFAVNDSNSTDDLVTGAMEGIVRKIRRSRPACEIIFIYTLNGSMTADLREGKLHKAVVAHEKVAAHYGIPSIHVGLDVAKREGDGTLFFTGTGAAKAAHEAKGKLVFARDTCHPHPEGHRLYTEAVTRRLPELLAAPRTTPTPLPPPLDAGQWEQSRMTPPQDFTLSPEWRRLEKNDWPPIAWSADTLPELWVADKPGAVLEASFTGSAFGLFMVIGPACGQVEWTLDGQPPVITPLFDPFCSYYRPNYLLLAHHLENKPHRIRIRLLADEPDKAALLARQGAVIDFPERFKGTRFYLAAGLVTGTLSAARP
jgi:lysophospholipase L1-like esterase